MIADEPSRGRPSERVSTPSYRHAVLGDLTIEVGASSLAAMAERPASAQAPQWELPPAAQARTNLARYVSWLREKKGLRFEAYHDLWDWSTTDLEAFWSTLWEYYDIQASMPYRQVLSSRRMPGAKWFEGARLNFAEHAFRNRGSDSPAIISRSELRPPSTLSWDSLSSQVASVAAALRSLGVRPGDRVAAYLPNIPETVVAFLATASIGAIWSSCAPDLGTQSVVDRLRQIEPIVLFAIDGYRYGGKDFDRRDAVTEIASGLPSIKITILVAYLREPGTDRWVDGAYWFEDLLGRADAEVTFEQVAFDHPLWVVYSSGTTGLPKAIVHGHGGILIESLKGLELHFDLGPDDRFFWFCSTSWIVWNFLVSGLLVGATIVLFDGSPRHPDLSALWQLADECGVTVFGASAAFLTACAKEDMRPASQFDLSAVREVCSTGSPLPASTFAWVYESVKSDVWLVSASGGTDLDCCLVGGCSILPVYAEEMQCRSLGARVEVLDQEGRSLIGEAGELVVREPMPSMPLYLWGDANGQRYVDSYFGTYPGTWRHGDWAKITARGTVVIYGRSDATLNRLGVRMGSSEIYDAIEDINEVVDSVVIGVDLVDGGYFMALFVVLKAGVSLSDELVNRIKDCIRLHLSPRHTPDEIIAVPDIPRTLNGKKLEVPIKRVLMGEEPDSVVDLHAVSNPEAFTYLAEFTRRLHSERSVLDLKGAATHG